MEYTRLGNSGLEVSRLCVGAMGFGDRSSEGHGGWVIEEARDAAAVSRGGRR